MSKFIENIIKKARTKKARIGFSDYTDNRLYEAIKTTLMKKIATPVIVGEVKEIKYKLRKFRIPEEKVKIFSNNNKELIDKFAKQYVKIRTKKEKLKIEEAKKIVAKENYFTVMLLYNNLIDGVVTGLSSQTKPFLPAFKIIGTEKNIKRVSSFFAMDFKDKTLFFADCAVNINPSSRELAEIATLTAKSVKTLGFKPRVAMLSFSTYGSAKHELVDKVREAAKIAKRKNKDKSIIIDGEVQFDAAFIPGVYKKKCPNSPLKGKANTFIFPDLDAGNIGYKLTERLAGAKAIGPILQGLKKPVNDISRGASSDDLALITAMTSLQVKR